MIDSESKRRFYRSPIVISGHFHTPISKRTWKLVQDALTRNQIAPTWHTYRASASNKIRSEDFRGAIIDLSIASETLIRQLIAQFLRPPINIAIQKIINGISLSRILDDWARIGFKNKGWKKLESERKDLKRVLDLRNANMHRGTYPEISRAQAVSLADAVSRFISYGEKQLHKK